MIALKTVIIQPDLSEADMLRFIREYSERHQLSESLVQKLLERVGRLSSSFTQIFIPYFEEKGSTRYDTIVDRMDEFIRRLKISVKNNQQTESVKQYACFWKKIKRNVNQEAQNHSKGLINCCDYLCYELDTIFEN